MKKVQKPVYKYCIVPECKNTIRSAPDKVFFPVPIGAKRRKEWCKVIRRDKILSATTCLHCCEDHFNIEEDTENYVQYHIMKQEGVNVTLRLNKGVLPHVFHRQNQNLPPPYVTTTGAIKRKRSKMASTLGTQAETQPDTGTPTQPRLPAEPQMARQRKGVELEKFKRRMIRAVARRLRENKPEDEVWQEMKKEIGSNCKKLWERMRMLTLKKLKRLLEADDRVCNIGQVARMTLTDWLLFDLVIVHEKIDVIDREKLTGNYNSKVLWNLFSLVQRFEIEGRVGENLAEAWTAATVYYNSKGHQCSPMMLQRRWFQIKELARHKFYKFWFSYRGNVKQLQQAKLDSPDDLQRAIALKYPQVITQSFPTWEERIQNRLVILPEELGVKMRQTKLMKPSDVNAPDVVLIEPQIEVIDLGADSDSEHEMAEISAIQPFPRTQIKSEPVDVDEHFEIEEAVFIPQEKGSEFEAEIERLQMVEEKISDVDELQENIDHEEENDESTIYADPNQQKEDKDENISTSDTNVNNLFNNDITVNEEERETVAEKTTSENTVDEGAIVIPDDDDELESTLQNIKAKGDEITTNNRTKNTVGDIADVAESKGVNTFDHSVEVKEENFSEVITDIAENDNDSLQIDTDNIMDQAEVMTEEEHLPVISTVSSAGVKVEGILSDFVDNVNNYVVMSGETSTLINHSFDQAQTEVPEILPVITNVSSAGVKVEIESTSVEFGIDLQNACTPQAYTEQEDVVDEVIPIEDDIIKLELPSEKDDGNEDTCDKGNDLIEFSNLHKDLNVVEDGIEFADDGIEYVEDEDDIITVTEPPVTAVKTRNEDQSQGGDEVMDEENEVEGFRTSNTETTDMPESQKFDLKLLMYPVVYTTKLEAMSLFDDESMYKQVYQKETIDKILTLSKPVSKQAIHNTEQLELEQNKYEGKRTDHYIVENNDIANESDDDLFQNESDYETEIIDDTKRVKLSSYMLQKPKNRSYNPILLCKNPDFNTRLKRLTVGFFMSARNRMLLQSCKPLTIDMSKAFESKLINGTMYLKPTPGDAVINIPDDTEVISADLIKPSSVQQSLMNIDDTLEYELRKRMAERNRAINLPNISEVRRLNQHLKTAEVTPLRLYETRPPDENIQSSKTVEKTTYPSNYIENIKNDIDKMLSQQKTNVANTEIIIDPVPNIIPAQPQKVQPTVTSPPALPQTPQVIDTYNVMQNVSRKNVLVNNTPELLNNMSHKNTTAEPIISVKDTHKPEKVRKVTKKTYYPTLPWNKPIDVAAVRDDSLLTIDTLYKMLSALDPCCNISQIVAPIKNKKKYKTYEENVTKQKESNVNDMFNDVSSSVIDITDDNINKPIQMKERKSKTVGRKKTIQDYCCWCRYIIDYLYGKVAVRRRHKCVPYECSCCCTTLFMQDVHCKNSNILAIRSLRGQLEHDLVSSSIENVVNEPGEAPTSIQVDDDNNDTPIETNTQTEIMMPSIEITIENSTNNSSKVMLSPTNSQPKPSFITRIQRNRSDKSDHTEKSEHKQGWSSNITCSRSVVPVHTCSCGPSITQVTQGKIEINGSCCCPTRKKLVKESKIYLRKQHIAEENQPFFVGKGKILLTNMKMPKNNTLAKPTITDTISPSICQVPESVTTEGVLPNSYTQNIGILPSTFPLPAGVQIVMLPDHTLSYFVQPGVSLTPDEYAGLNNFLLSIQHQVKASGVTLPSDQPVANITEVIDLESDESPQENNPQSMSSSEENVKTDMDLTVAKDDSSKAFAPGSSNNDSCETDSIRVDVSQTDAEHNTSKIDPVIQNKDTPEINEIQCVDSTISKDVVPNDEPITNPKDSLPDKDKLGVSEHSKNTEDNIVPVAESKTTQEFKDTESRNAEGSSNKKNLLSDLMEMSGIFEEDIAPPVQKILPQEPIATTSAFHGLVPQMTDITPEIVLPVRSLPPIRQKRNEFELNAVTSFAELKYACDNNGVFFKLDLETGEMTTINVCIQKLSSGKTKSKVDSDKSVIDLTDDPDICITGSTEESASNLPKRLPNKSEISSILLKKQKLMERLSNNLKPINILQSKKHVARILKKNRSLIRDHSFSFYSKRKLDEIETHIDLVDSDDEMESVQKGDGSDSDDEPLIKKAKRKREAEAVASIAQPEDKHDDMPNTKLNESVEQHNDQEMAEQDSNDRNVENEPPHDSDQDDYMGEVEYLEDMDDLIPSSVIQPEVPVPTNLVLSGNALNAHNIPLNSTLSADGGESTQDDCILGV